MIKICLYRFLLISLLVFPILPANAQDSLNVRRIGFCSIPRRGESVAVSGNNAYIAFFGMDGTGIRVVNFSNPTNPQQVGSCNLPGQASGVDVSGNYAYVAAGDSGLRIVNISNPTNLQTVGRCVTPGSACGIVVSGNYAYVADGEAGLRIINVSNPAIPQPVGFFPAPGNDPARGVTVSGNYAYVAFRSGLRIINIANPTSPQLMGFCRTGGEGMRVAVSGNYAYFTNEGMFVIDISNRANPQPVSHFSVESGVEEHAFGVVVAGSFVFTAHYNDGLRVINVSNPARPFGVGYYCGREPMTVDVKVVGNVAYLVNDSTFDVLDCSQSLSVSDPAPTTLPTHFSLSSPYPNPFNASTLIRFELPQRNFVKVQVFDAVGREVTTLAEENMNAGTHQVTWNGAKVGSGEYFVRMSVPQFSETKKVVLVK